MKRERGMVWWVYLAIAGAAVGALFTMYTVIDSRGYARGMAVKQREWSESILAGLQRARNRADAVDTALDAAREKADQAARKAATYKTNWERAVADAKRSAKSLGSCQARTEPPGADAPAGDAAGTGLSLPAARGGTPVSLHWRFVGLHDAAFTGLSGEPVFGVEAAYALDPARADTASPYTLGDAIEVAGKNADALGTCRREYFGALSAIMAAEKAWGEKSR